MYNAKVKNIADKILDITNLTANASLNTKLNDVKCEIPIITNLATNASLIVKINKVKGEIPNIKNLATTAPPTSIENGMPNASNLLKSSDCNTKISDTKK